MPMLKYERQQELNLNNLTAILEKELYVEFNRERAEIINGFMHSLNVRRHRFDLEQVAMWKILISRLVGEN